MDSSSICWSILFLRLTDADLTSTPYYALVLLFLEPAVHLLWMREDLCTVEESLDLYCSLPLCCCTVKSVKWKYKPEESEKDRCHLVTLHVVTWCQALSLGQEKRWACGHVFSLSSHSTNTPVVINRNWVQCNSSKKWSKVHPLNHLYSSVNN